MEIRTIDRTLLENEKVQKYLFDIENFKDFSISLEEMLNPVNAVRVVEVIEALQKDNVEIPKSLLKLFYEATVDYMKQCNIKFEIEMPHIDEFGYIDLSKNKKLSVTVPSLSFLESGKLEVFSPKTDDVVFHITYVEIMNLPRIEVNMDFKASEFINFLETIIESCVVADLKKYGYKEKEG